MVVLLINVYTPSSTKLEIRAKQFLPGSEGAGGVERERVGRKGGVGGKGGSNDQSLYACMNKGEKK
jgi:hypothetical protein